VRPPPTLWPGWAWSVSHSGLSS